MSWIKDEPLTSLALFWRLERADGAGLALTSHDAQVRINGEDYLPSPGMVPAAVTRGLGLEPSSTEIAASLSSDLLTGEDLAAGRWDGAVATLFAANWDSPGAPPIALAEGVLADISLSGDSFTAELHGAAARLGEPVCPSTSPHCRAEFGDKACRVDLASRTVRTSVAAWAGAELEVAEALDERFAFGRLRYLSGANCGAETVILKVYGAQLRVRDLPRSDVLAGTVVELREGCDKRLQTCAERFANAANFRGEPHLPGMDLLTRYPGA